MKILLTGATGFVGRHLAGGLDEHELHVLTLRHTGAANETIADLRAPLDLRLLPQTIDVVIHAAGLVGATGAPSELYRETNVMGTLHVARAAVAMRATRFMLLSTGGVYQPSATPLTEASAVAPKGDYAVSKWESEQVASSFRSEIRVQIARLFFPYGPGQGEERLVPRLIGRIRNGESVSAVGGHGPLLNPIYIDDLVESIRRLLAIEDDFLVNLAGPETVSIREIAERIEKLVEIPAQIVATPDVPQSWMGDSSLAAQLTNYAPHVSMEDGLRRTITKR